MTQAEQYARTHDRLPSMREVEDAGWSEGYDDDDRAVVEFDDGSIMRDDGSTGMSETPKWLADRSVK